MKKLFFLCLLNIAFISCGQNNQNTVNKELKKSIVTRSINLFNGILDNDYDLFYDNYTKEMFRFTGTKQSYGKGISNLSKAKKTEMLNYLHHKLKKTMKNDFNSIRLKNIAFSIAVINDKELGGSITLIFGNEAENYQFHYLAYREYNGELSIALGNDDFNKVNLDEILSNYRSKISFKGVESDVFIENLN